MLKKILIMATFFILFTPLVLGLFFYQGIYTPKDRGAEDVMFIIKEGDGMRTVAERLAKEGVIRSDYFFIIYGKLTDKGGLLKPGSYKISSKMNVPEIINLFVQGSEDRLIVIEGWNLRDIGVFLEDNGYAEKEDFVSLVGRPPSYRDGKVISQKQGSIDFIEEFSFLNDVPEGLPIEGYLFPDTYFISPGTPLDSIIKTVLANFEKRVVYGLKEDLEESEKSLFEIITRASLIEKEVRSYEDKRLVAGIINNRIERGMRLQLDATISYLTGRRSVQIPISETRIQSPYNTYVISGLPKGPICNPGLESIKAVLNPQESDYIYYLSKTDGETVFSRTHEEHVRAKNRYLR